MNLNITKIIFTEGLADEIFIKKLINDNNIKIKNIKIKNLDGKDNFTPKKIIAESDIYINDKNCDRIDLLLIRDADDNFNDTEQSITNLITNLRSNRSKNKYLRNIEYYILPNNKDSGQLEHLLCKAIESHDVENMECFKKMAECLAIKKITTNNKLSELQLNAYLALKEHNVGTKKFVEGELFKNLLPSLINDDWCKKLKEYIIDFVKK